MRESDTESAEIMEPRFEKALNRLLFEESKTVTCTFLSAELGVSMEIAKW